MVRGSTLTCSTSCGVRSTYGQSPVHTVRIERSVLETLPPAPPALDGKRRDRQEHDKTGTSREAPELTNSLCILTFLMKLPLFLSGGRPEALLPPPCGGPSPIVEATEAAASAASKAAWESLAEGAEFDDDDEAAPCDEPFQPIHPEVIPPQHHVFSGTQLQFYI